MFVVCSGTELEDHVILVILTGKLGIGNGVGEDKVNKVIKDKCY